MASENSSHLPLKLILKFISNIALVWALSTYLSEYFVLSGGIPAFIIVGALISLLNIFVRPLLAIIMLPLRFFASIIAIMIVNGLIVYVVHIITLQMNPAVVTLSIDGGPWGWILIAICFGITNWLLKKIFT